MNILGMYQNISGNSGRSYRRLCHSIDVRFVKQKQTKKTSISECSTIPEEPQNVAVVAYW